MCVLYGRRNNLAACVSNLSLSLQELSSFLFLLINMSLETVPKDIRQLRACLLCSLVKVSIL